MSTHDSLVAYIKALEEKLNQVMDENRRLNEMIKVMQKNQFGRSKETVVPTGQMSLFEDESQKKSHSAEETTEETEEVQTYRRRKPKGLKQANLDQYPQTDVIHTLEEKDCQCHDCHSSLTFVGTSLVRRELNYQPANFECVNHYQESFKCTQCALKTGEESFTASWVPKAPLSNSLGSASLIAETVYQKYVLKVPAYRQEAHWALLGLPLSRATICNWHVKVSEYYLSYIYSFLQSILLSQDVIHADETSFRVLESLKEKTYYWLIQSSKHAEHPVAFYGHRDGRSYTDFLSLIGDYKGTIHCDMYSVYLKHSRENEDIQVSACWAHLRRKFYDSLIADSENTPAHEIVKQIDAIFKKEREWQTLSVSERHQKRQSTLRRKIDKLFRLIDQYQKNSRFQGEFTEGLNYAVNHREYFYTVLTDGRLELSNNLAERSIKSMVMGRKNYLFAQSFNGAQAGAMILTLIETAKLNEIDPRTYIEYLLTHLPNEEVLSQADFTRYLPWATEVQEHCRLTRPPKIAKSA